MPVMTSFWRKADPGRRGAEGCILGRRLARTSESIKPRHHNLLHVNGKSLLPPLVKCAIYKTMTALAPAHYTHVMRINAAASSKCFELLRGQGSVTIITIIDGGKELL